MPLHEFLSYGPQKDGANVKPMFRKTKDGRIFEWNVVKDDPLCTLQDAFVKVKRSVGFNIELKFDDNTVYGEEALRQTLGNILKVNSIFFTHLIFVLDLTSGYQLFMNRL